jgi:hypothetical protein
MPDKKQPKTVRTGATPPSESDKKPLWKAGARMRLVGENAIMSLPGILQTIAVICLICVLLAPVIGLSLSRR